jgi:hypothetical protein
MLFVWSKMLKSWAKKDICPVQKRLESNGGNCQRNDFPSYAALQSMISTDYQRSLRMALQYEKADAPLSLRRAQLCFFMGNAITTVKFLGAALINRSRSNMVGDGELRM